MKTSDPFMASMGRTVGVLSVVAMAAACGGGDDSSSRAPLCVALTETVTIVSGDQQTGAPGAVLPERVTARFSCESFANRGTRIPLTGSVSWYTFPGRVDGEFSITRQLDADGVTSVTWALPNRWDSPQGLTVSKQINASRDVHASFTATVAGTMTTARTCNDPGGTDHGPRTVLTADTAWAAAGSPHRGGTIVVENGAQLSIEAGSVICVSAIEPAASATSSALLAARGTEQAPVRFFGTALRLADSLIHVQGENLPVVGRVEQPIGKLEDSTFRWTAPRDASACAQVVAAVGSGLQRTVISGHGSPDCAALLLAFHPSWNEYYSWGHDDRIEVRVLGSVGDGVASRGGVALHHCEVSSSGRHGIVIDDWTSVSGCNLFGNGGNAVVNQSAATVDARGNWWGNPSGPFGPNGDGVAGAVDAGDPRAASVVLGY